MGDDIVLTKCGSVITTAEQCPHGYLIGVIESEPARSWMDNNLVAAVVVAAFFAVTSMALLWVCDRVAAWRHDRKLRKAFNAPWHPDWEAPSEP